MAVVRTWLGAVCDWLGSPPLSTETSFVTRVGPAELAASSASCPWRVGSAAYCYTSSVVCLSVCLSLADSSASCPWRLGSAAYSYTSSVVCLSVCLSVARRQLSVLPLAGTVALLLLY